MPSKNPVAYVIIRTFAHATEDRERVLKALHNVLPSELSETVEFKTMNVEGHYGNPIVLFEAIVKDKKAASAVLEKLAAGLSVLDKELLGREVERHVDRGNLYLRLDKQAAYLGDFKLGQADSIHLQVHFKKHMFEEVVGVVKEFGLIP